ncbi:hypothetical protein [Massilia litorea]|uniref:Uncharacterized protein n=1 Tax=Massilia litorea TaxID=2769491 RepID=A0A7L9U3D6_9BURK|nr:hypothetical protein [Massilia litorea]QOL48536.1 hypothetical protein LPB04_16415 [Massilia litorea]
MMDAARDGLVLRRPAGFHASLDRVHPSHSTLLEAPAALRAEVDRDRLPGISSIWDLFAKTRRVVYRRDNY